MPIPVIHDGDHGGDDFITTLLFLANPDIYNLIGITTTVGNVGVLQATKNALKAIGLSGISHDIPVYTGSEKSYKGYTHPSDDAFHSDGLGGVVVPETNRVAETEDAVEWLAKTLLASQEKITICATGPLTNMARLIQKYPDVKTRIKEIIVMGGGDKIGGNVKPYAEFNFYMDPEAANFVLNSGVPVVLHTLDTTHQLIFTKDRQAQIAAIQPADFAKIISGIMRITEDLEKKSFGVEGAFMHDENTALYLAMPELYETKAVNCRVIDDPDHEEYGRFQIIAENEDSTVLFVSNNTDIDRAFSFILESLSVIAN